MSQEIDCFGCKASSPRKEWWLFNGVRINKDSVITAAGFFPIFILLCLFSLPMGIFFLVFVGVTFYLAGTRWNRLEQEGEDTIRHIRELAAANEDGCLTTAQAIDILRSLPPL